VGFEKFKSCYPALVRTDFRNYYAIARLGSKVSSKAFQEFSHRAGITLISEADSRPFGINPEMIDGLWRCEEGVIDIDIFRDTLYAQILNSSIQMVSETEIIKMMKTSKRWSLQDSLGATHEGFDYIVRATYGNDQIQSEDIDLKTTEYEYHRTIILEVESDSPTMGLTVMDGDFLTVLPKGFTHSFLIYAPSISVLDRFHGKNPKLSWKDSKEDIEFAIDQLITRTQMWLPDFNVKEQSGGLVTTRSIQPAVSATDKRVSQTKWLSEEIVEIWSGKIDHCIEISEKISNQIDFKCRMQR